MADLITLQEYKTAKGIAKVTEDPVYAHLIAVASDIVQTYLDRSYIDPGVPITEVFSFDYDTQVIFLENYPVTQLISLTEIDPYGNDSTVHYPTDTSAYYLDAPNGKIIRTGRGFWPQGNRGVIVTYRAGNADATAIPPALKRVVIDLVSYYHNEEYKDSKQLRGSVINNNTGSGNTNSPSTAFPPHIQRVLDLYK